jgi:hypothetical protein
MKQMESPTFVPSAIVTRDMIDWSRIPDVQTAKNLLKCYFPDRLFPRLNDNIKKRIGSQFCNWNQGTPDICVARQDWCSLKEALDYAGCDLPLLVITQISFGPGMGHSRIGLHRCPRFEGEKNHTYLYHAAPGLILKGGQAADYCRLDYVSHKPTLYVFWILNYDICHQGAEELHRRWMYHRYRTSDHHYCDCATFVNDFARHMASIGKDENNPFNYSIPSHTIVDFVSSEERGLYAILRYTHRPPAMLLFVQDPSTYDRICSHGSFDKGSWIVDYDSPELNVTRQ